MGAVAIETGYYTVNPFRVCKSPSNFVTLAHLEPKEKERVTATKMRRRMIIDSFTAVPRIKITPIFPSDSSYPKWIFPNITSCHSNRHQPDNLAGKDLGTDRH
ncbi:hypothetical protein AVEN_144620-1 [Araneus ventricosus]|uniref:Uncharacterized protein n=1 Tax=Araneus ventricosus TaxID=182803 RepID=A0A4Y2C1E1_ARAVE|nr:hypothetical protein AVEN_144620-1 [Araneus ventricosus]